MVPCGERLLFQSLKFIRVKVHREGVGCKSGWTCRTGSCGENRHLLLKSLWQLSELFNAGR